MRMTKPLALLTGVVMAAVVGVGVNGPANASSTGMANGPTAVGASSSVPDQTVLRVIGTLADGTGAVEGVLDLQRFTAKNQTLQVLATFTGTITDAAGMVTDGSEQVMLPVDLTQSTGASRAAGTAAAQDAQLLATCEVLDLVLGPLDLNLLGLVVHLDQVHLIINAESGPGNLLGNLLCALFGLLDGPGLIPGILNAIAALLNRLLAILG